jgi:hypothetical protein
MTVELGHSFANLFVQEPQERVNADLIEIRLAAPPTIELRDVPNFGVTPHGHSDAPPPGEQGRKHFGIAMQVVMRVHMRRCGADELHEPHLLTFNLGSNVARIDPI